MESSCGEDDQKQSRRQGVGDLCQPFHGEQARTRPAAGAPAERTGVSPGTGCALVARAARARRPQLFVAAIPPPIPERRRQHVG